MSASTAVSMAADATSANGSPTPPSMHRRPPRKSTLTQQQKNQKRQRATQDQLVLLEVEFEKNPTPTAVVRERIANDINMTERSVQIWFQNRRAKIKNLVKKSIENGEDSNEIPDSMRRYLAMQALETGKPLGRDFMMPRFGTGNLNLAAFETPSNKVVIQHFTCRSLTVGSWRRIGQSAMDLVVFYSPEKETITYYINNDSAGYKIEYSFDYISNITLNSGDPASPAEGASQSGAIVVELNRPPRFFMDSSGSGGFYEVGDFTEDQQATKFLRHELGGAAKVLSGQLAKLVALESFYNRHRKDPFHFATPAKPVAPSFSRPMQPPTSPPMHRPASQPSQFIDDTHLALMQEPVGLGAGLHPPRGHKRQRSRSVPVAIDWSMMRGPMTDFLSPPGMHPISPYIPSPDIIAPVPINSFLGGSHGNPMSLSIDTSAFSTDFNRYPMSATTAPSPSDFGTPAFFSAAPDGTTSNDMAATPFGTQSLMSPMPDPTAGTPTPTQMHILPVGGDPVIANHSPPLTSLGHGPNESDFSLLGADGHVLADDGLTFDWGESKQPMLSLPMRPTTASIEDQHHHQASTPVAFLDPSQLTNGPM